MADKIKKINESGYLAIVITNQPVVARGEITFHELDVIHNKMETLPGQAGAYIDGLYYCPHHLHSGYEGEIKELKTECDCRKPKPGMILKAAEEYNIDIASSWMIGDGEHDVLAGKNAGCHTAYISQDGNNEYDAEVVVKGLREFVNICANLNEWCLASEGSIFYDGVAHDR